MPLTEGPSPAQPGSPLSSLKTFLAQVASGINTGIFAQPRGRLQSLLAEVAFGIDGGLTAGSCSSHRLAVV